MRAVNLNNSSAVTSAEVNTEFRFKFNKQFKSEDIEFFNSELDIENDSTITDNKLWIQNVFVFIQQIKNIAAIKEEEIVRSNLLLCLWEAAVIWYTDLLNDVEKTELRLNFHLWYKILKTCFHKNSVIALRKLSELRYICLNVLNQVSADIYIVKAIHHVKICSQIKYSALLTAWQEINMKM